MKRVNRETKLSASLETFSCCLVWKNAPCNYTACIDLQPSLSNENHPRSSPLHHCVFYPPMCIVPLWSLSGWLFSACYVLQGDSVESELKGEKRYREAKISHFQEMETNRIRFGVSSDLEIIPGKQNHFDILYNVVLQEGFSFEFSRHCAFYRHPALATHFIKTRIITIKKPLHEKLNSHITLRWCTLICSVNSKTVSFNFDRKNTKLSLLLRPPKGFRRGTKNKKFPSM